MNTPRQRMCERCRNRLTTRTEASTHRQDDQTDSLRHSASRSPKPLRQTRYRTHTPRPRGSLLSVLANLASLRPEQDGRNLRVRHSRAPAPTPGKEARRKETRPGWKQMRRLAARRLQELCRCSSFSRGSATTWRAKVGEYLGPEQRGNAESACSAVLCGDCQCAFSS